MNFLFAWRYFKAKKTTNAINIIAWVSILAIIVGTTALILVLSVYNGFEDLVKSLYSSFYPDIKISGISKNLVLTQKQIDELRKIPGIKTASMVVEEKSFVQNGDYQSFMVVKGVDENYKQINDISTKLAGNYDIGTATNPHLIIGAGIENALGIQADKSLFPVTITLPRKTDSKQIDILNDISTDTISTSASFMIQQDFDNKYGITHIDFIKRALGLDSNTYTCAEIKLQVGQKPARVKENIYTLLGDNVIVQDKYEQNSSLYSVMKMERWIIYGVLCLILIIAAFNMIGALTMLILEKKKDISLLHALGTPRKKIQQIFLTEGMLLAFIGCMAGMALALSLAILQLKFHLIPLTGGSFLINYFPVKLRLFDFLLVGATVCVIALFASWIPASKAARQSFSLRSE